MDTAMITLLIHISEYSSQNSLFPSTHILDISLLKEIESGFVNQSTYLFSLFVFQIVISKSLVLFYYLVQHFFGNIVTLISCFVFFTTTKIAKLSLTQKQTQTLIMSI